MYGQSVFWRETMKNGKFLIFEGRVVFVLLPTFIHMRLWTISIAVFTMFMFWWFDRKGVSTDAIIRFLKSKLIGKKRTARGVYEERSAIDFSFETRVYERNLKIEAARNNATTGKKTLLGRLGFGVGSKNTGDDVSLSKE
ncbi:IcmT/TraK family protein [Pseudosulfitobacter pseudonitzschiae]|uniref:IcmT/TraK family protein n=1 Tax=Pseudosulfitobacter pseudonitzschiae TaxID=1402135 RepID=UPI003B797E3D